MPERFRSKFVLALVQLLLPTILEDTSGFSVYGREIAEKGLWRVSVSFVPGTFTF